MGGSRGRRIDLADRESTVGLIEEAIASGARKRKACEVLGIPIRTVQRWTEGDVIKKDQRKYNKRSPINKLTDEECESVLDICNSPKYKSLPPSQIVPSLADAGIYVASEASFYRILKENKQLHPRGKSKPRTHSKPDPYIATGTNQVWSWDITYLPTNVKGLFYYLYMIMDIYSRKIVGWEIYESQNDELSSIVIRRACLSEGISGKELVLHSDNGSPMKGATMLATLQKLGVVPSFSRPSVSNDNPYSESLFKTLKYNPGYPSKPFESLDEARFWVLGFTRWYNETHKHSSLRFVTPSQRHEGKDKEILENRKRVYMNARARHPERWSGDIRDWNPGSSVFLNPGKTQKNERIFEKAA